MKLQDLSSADFKHIAFCSGGKDSVATLILSKEHGEPLDAVVFVEVMFDENTSGEHPLHLNFISNKLAPFIEQELKVPFIILRSDKTYVDCFFHLAVKGKHIGKPLGFPIPGMCCINRDCKMRPIRQIKATLKASSLIEYVGIAEDEPIRLQRLQNNHISLLSKHGYTEEKAKQLCIDNGLLSPVYEVSKRNGCWFCMNCSDNEWVWLMRNKPELFDKLMSIEKTPDIYRECLTRTETPSQLFERLKLDVNQIRFF